MPITRRELVALGGLAAAAARAHVSAQPGPAGSRLRARRTAPMFELGPGEHPLRFGSDRDGLLRVPRQYRAGSAAPLAVLLHGAGGSGQGILKRLDVADRFGVVVLAPDSRGRTWDVIRSQFGPDVEFLDRALAHTFRHCVIDGRRIAIGGFSDGASYALSVGLDNGGLFTHILAFSPGFIASRARIGRPRIFVSHGTRDDILRIDATSRRLVPALEHAEYPVTYREFDGGHTVPPPVADEGFKWFLG
jgi:phospholipase/carboxylesterase